MSALLNEVTRVLEEMGVTYSFPFGKEVVCPHPNAENPEYEVSIHVTAERSEVNVKGRIHCFVAQRRRAAAEALLKAYRKQHDIDLCLDEADGHLVAQKLLKVGEAGLSREMLSTALETVRRAAMEPYKAMREQQRENPALLAEHLRRNWQGWLSGTVLLGRATFGGQWAPNSTTIHEEPKEERTPVCADVSLFAPPFQELKEDELCTAAEKLAMKLLELGAEKYEALAGELEAVQDAGSAAAAERPCVELLREVAAIHAVLQQCRISPQARKRIEVQARRYQRAYGRYAAARTRALSAKPAAYGDAALRQMLDGEAEYVYDPPEDLEKLMTDTLSFLKTVNEELLEVAAGPESYTKAAATFVERRLLPDEPILSLALRWARFCNGNASPPTKNGDLARKEVQRMLHYASWCHPYGAALENILYLRRVRSTSDEYLSLKDWVDTYSALLLPVQLSLEGGTVEVDMDCSIRLYDELLAECERMKQEDDHSEKIPKRMRTLYGNILYLRTVCLNHYLETASPHESCLYRLLMTRMQTFAERCSKDDYGELWGMASDTREALRKYDVVKITDNEEEALTAMPLMLRILYAEQLTKEQRALEALRAVGDKKSADAAAEVCAEALRFRRRSTALRQVLSVSDEDRAKVMEMVGNHTERWAASLDAELGRVGASAKAAHGSEALAAVSKGVDEEALTDVYIDHILFEAEGMLKQMADCLGTYSESDPSTFHKQYFPFVAYLAQLWLRMEYQPTPLTRSQIEKYAAGMKSMVNLLEPVVQRYMECDLFADSLGTCARMLPPLRKAIASHLAGEDDERPPLLKAAVKSAEMMLSCLQRVRDAESARAVLPELQQEAERFRVLQMEHLEFFSSADALMWPEILELRLFHHEFVQAADALRSADDCHRCPGVAKALKDIALSWIPNLSAKK